MDGFTLYQEALQGYKMTQEEECQVEVLTKDSSTTMKSIATAEASTKIDKKWRQTTQRKNKARTGDSSTDEEFWVHKYRDVNQEAWPDMTKWIEEQ